LPDPLLRVSSASAGYRGVKIVREVSLSVAASDIALVVGPNGAGKSTLVKAVIGELPLLGGRIEFDGIDVSDWDEERRAVSGIGYVPQTRDVFPTLSVTENLEVGGYRLSGKECRRAIARTFERFPALEHLRHRKASQLSGGERKQLAIARALMSDPKVVILDEPTAGLAPRIAHMVLEELVVGLGELGRGVLLIEQRVTLAAAIASHVTVLVDGAVRYAASGEEFRAVPDVSALFFGTEQAAVGGSAGKSKENPW
jgi:branched-chain amino acid transport system ATP-binding protein